MSVLEGDSDGLLSQEQLAAWLEHELTQAIALHQQGQLAEAEAIYLQVIERCPTQANANHNLAQITLARGALNEALALFKTALEAAPDESIYWVSYIHALIQAGHYDEARMVMSYGVDSGLQGDEVDALQRKLLAAATPVTSASHKTAVTPNMQNLVLAFNRGDLVASETLALAITRGQPANGLAWKVLGAVYEQQGLPDAAFNALKKAAELLPQDAEAQYNLGNYFYDQQQLDTAALYYEKAVTIDAGFAKAYYNLASVRKEQGRLSEAEASYKQALVINPDNAAMNFNLGLMLFERGDFSAAITYYQQGLQFQPDAYRSYVIMGASFKALGRLQEADSAYQAALSINPDCLDAHNNLGVLLKEQGKLSDAERCYRTAIAIDAHYATGYNNLGLLLQEQGKLAEAEDCYKKALEIDPSRAISFNNLAVIYRDQGRLSESEACCRSAIELDDDFTDAHNNLGLVLDAMARYADAEAAYRKVLEKTPDNAAVLSNLAMTLSGLNRLSESEACLKRALALEPRFVNACVNLSSNYLAQGRVVEAEALCVQALQIQPDSIDSIDNLLFLMNYSLNYSVDDCLEKAREYGVIAAGKVGTVFNRWLHQPQPERLRIGFVSGDLRRHAVAFFLENLVKHIDQSQFELIAYPTDSREDEVTVRLKPNFSGWHSLVGLSDEAAAKLIHSHGLHVLLDLSGHSACNRLPVFAWKPAPVQVSWLGYFATTGLAAMDYFLADEVGVPALNQAHFVERVKYLPDTRLCFTPPHAVVEVMPLPALDNGYVTFGCFQNMAKVGDDVMDLWAQVMRALPTSKLRWQCKSFNDPLVVDEVKRRFLRYEISAERLNLVSSTVREAYLAAHAEVDFILDTFPFNGGTTTCEALWMGVPTLTMAGNTLIARQGASLMSAAGLADWVVESKADYLKKALQLAGDIDQLAALRLKLRAQVLASPLFDGARFADNMGLALWAMWRETSQAYIEQQHPQFTQPAIGDARASRKLGSPLVIVTVTRFAEGDFWQKSALGLSLKRHLKQDARLTAHVTFERARGYPEALNDYCDRAADDAIMVLMHEDVWIDEASFVDSVQAGLAQFDVIGVTGNRRRLPNQVSWEFTEVKDGQLIADDSANLSGRLAYGKHAFARALDFGPLPMACELLNDIFMAVKVSTLRQHRLAFDTRFDSYFCEMDFYRAARQLGLKLGTWPVKLTHQHGAEVDATHWSKSYHLYLNKWEGEVPGTDPLQDAMREVLQMAIAHQHAGQLAEARALYEEILKVQPSHAEAKANLAAIVTNENA